MKLDMQRAKEVASVCCDHARMAVKWADKKLSGIYAEYDINADGKICLCDSSDSADNESGDNTNTLNTSCKGKIRFTAKDVLCALAIFTVFASLLRSIVKRSLK